MVEKAPKFNQLFIKNLIYKVNVKTIFQNFNLEINKLEKILIIGFSSSGKSTLFNILIKKQTDFDGETLLNSLLNLKQTKFDKIL